MRLTGWHRDGSKRAGRGDRHEFVDQRAVGAGAHASPRNVGVERDRGHRRGRHVAVGVDPTLPVANKPGTRECGAVAAPSPGS